MTYGIWFEGATAQDWCEHDGGIVYVAFETLAEATAEAERLHIDRQRALNSDIGRHWADRDATFTARELPHGQRFVTKRGDVATARGADRNGTALTQPQPQPFDLAFNAAVMTLARKVCPAGYDVAHDGSAPESLPALQDHIARTHRICVDGRNSENTIFGCPEHNWAFRAWHDWTHWVLSAPFTLDGELSVAHRQIEDLKRVFGHGARTDRWAQLILAEVYGQALYFSLRGTFPSDQVAFDAAWLAGSFAETVVDGI